MRRINLFIAISAFSFLMLCVPGIASAQYGQYDPYGRNTGYGNGGYNNGDMRSVVRDLKSKAGQFQKQLDRDLDHGRYNGSQREDEMNQLARDFKSAVNHLNSNGYDNGRNGDLNRVFDLANQIDRVTGRGRVSSNAQYLWTGIRSDLGALGYNGGGYNNRNRGNRGGNRNNRNNNVPSWWPF